MKRKAFAVMFSCVFILECGFLSGCSRAGSSKTDMPESSSESLGFETASSPGCD